MICYTPASNPDHELWVSNVQFTPAVQKDIENRFLGWVTCQVRGTMWLRHMRVRLLDSGQIRIKVRRGGRDEVKGLVELSDLERAKVQELILRNASFLSAIDALFRPKTPDA